MRIFPAPALFWLAIWALAVPGIRAQPAAGGTVALADLKPGEQGEVWTVFRGTVPGAVFGRGDGHRPKCPGARANR